MLSSWNFVKFLRGTSCKNLLHEELEGGTKLLEEKQQQLNYVLNKYFLNHMWNTKMKSFFFPGLLFFCLLIITTNAQNLLPERTFENFKKNKGLMLNQEEEMLMHEKSMSRDLPWQVSTKQRQDPVINPRVNNRKKKEISKLNGSIYRPVLAVADANRRYSYTYDNNGNELTYLIELGANNVWTNSERYSSIYDDNGNILNYLHEEWQNAAWMNYLRTTYSYDNNGNELTFLQERWANNTWVNRIKYSYTYDTNGNELTYLHEDWQDNAWVNNEKYSSTYYNNGNKLTSTKEVWLNNKWIISFRETFTYNNKGEMLTLLLEGWSGNMWVNNVLHTYTFDDKGNQLTWLVTSWSNNSWVNFFRQTSNYDESGNKITDLYENWGDTIWTNNYRNTSTYDNQGNKLTDIHDTWVSDAWVNDWRNTFTYDSHRNRLTYYNEQWRNDSWLNFEGYKYTFDNYGNGIKGEHFAWVNNVWVPSSNFFQLCYNFGADYLSVGGGATVDVTYKLIITDVTDDKLTANTYSLYQNYPNPFNPSTVIQYALPYESNVSISVYNTLGEVVKTFNEGAKQTGSYNVNFNGEGLSSGIYLYNLNAVSIDGKQNFQATKKMLLIK